MIGRLVKTISDVTLGTVIVVAHAQLANRDLRRRDVRPIVLPDGTRVWRSQISP
jgi:hypothetical protein